MAAFSISVARIAGKEMVTVTLAANRAWKRPLNYEMFIGSHLPDIYWHDCGALVNAIFRAFAHVEKITIFVGEYRWIAEANISDSLSRIRRGEGNTPVEALVALIRDLFHPV